jgi:hypothetical protein
MHIEKNRMDNILGTILDIQGKTKDDLAARTDLVEMGLRHKLHPFAADDGRTYMPTACHTMFKDDKTHFLKVIRNVRVLDGYAFNVSRCVRLKERTISGLKSHDSHVLMQQLLPFALCGSLSDNVVRPLVEISTFFRGLCSTNLTQEDMDRLQGDVCVTLCKMEQIFPPPPGGFLRAWFTWSCILSVNADSGDPYSIDGCIRQRSKICAGLIIILIFSILEYNW